MTFVASEAVIDMINKAKFRNEFSLVVKFTNEDGTELEFKIPTGTLQYTEPKPDTAGLLKMSVTYEAFATATDKSIVVSLKNTVASY
jgi:hypothetical protein